MFDNFGLKTLDIEVYRGFVFIRFRSSAAVINLTRKEYFLPQFVDPNPE